MTVTRVQFVQDVDNSPNIDDTEGHEWVNQKIYRLVNDDGTEQFVALDVDVDSYGNDQTPRGLRLVERKTKTVEVWA